MWAAIPPLHDSTAGWAVVPVAVIVQEIARGVFIRLYLSDTRHTRRRWDRPVNRGSLCCSCSLFFLSPSRAERSFSVVSINAIVFPLIDLYSGIAAGVGFGAMQTFVYYATLFGQSLGPGTLYSPHCPHMSAFVSAAWTALMFNLMHVCWMVVAIDAYRRANPLMIGGVALLNGAAAGMVRQQAQRTCQPEASAMHALLYCCR